LDRAGEGRCGLLSFNLAEMPPAELAAILDEHFDVAVRSGLFCAPYAHRHLGTFPDGAVRVSVGFLTTRQDVVQAAAALNEIAAA
jgi:selenocysteine lyase/cysteine desulfurase